ncbi:hypothetical protein M1N00_00125 [Thermodesulfovibrionales bacterium]|nr:hypothetical protein [Thermodesulfovibrionales bacterium]
MVEGRLSGATTPVGKEPRIVRDNGSQFIVKEWQEVMRHFELEEIPIREERLHSALKYLRPVDYYRDNPEALLAERKRKLREATARRKGEEIWSNLTKIAYTHMGSGLEI